MLRAVFPKQILVAVFGGLGILRSGKRFPWVTDRSLLVTRKGLLQYKSVRKDQHLRWQSAILLGHCRSSVSDSALVKTGTEQSLSPSPPSAPFTLPPVLMIPFGLHVNTSSPLKP